jgi:hypothetical protein
LYWNNPIAGPARSHPDTEAGDFIVPLESLSGNNFLDQSFDKARCQLHIAPKSGKTMGRLETNSNDILR